MKIILGTDSLQTPLTGIGRYTLELARGLLASEDIEQVLGFDLGHFHSLQARLDSLRGDAKKITATETLRQSLAKSKLATQMYRHYLSLLSGWNLRRHSDALFHSPNFHLPRNPGPSIVTIHDLSFTLFADYHPDARVAWMEAMVPEALEASSHIISVSESTRRDLVSEYGVDPEKITTVYPGIESSFQRRYEAETLPVMESHHLHHGEYFLCVATLEPRKNIDGLIDAYLLLPHGERLKHPLVLVGGFGWKYRDLQARINSLSNQGVMHLGYVAEVDLPSLYSGALCFVYPSIYEGFGLPILEAQASGVPVICSEVSSMPEVASDQALLVNPNDIESLSQTMYRSLHDINWREACTASGLAKSREFSWEHCVDSTIKLYKHIQNRTPLL